MKTQLIWLKYNWKWAIPLVALGIFVPVTSCVFLTVLLVSFLGVRSLKVYKLTMTAVRADARPARLIGTPLQPGILVLGTYSRRVSGPMVNLTVPLYGPEGKATAFAVAAKTDGKWQFTTLQIQVKGQQEHIDLLKPEEL